MSITQPPISNETLLEYRDFMHNNDDKFIEQMPKVELHVHIEGTMTPELRWALAERSGEFITNPSTGVAYQDLTELKVSYDLLRTHESGGVEGGMARFFELYYEGFTALRNEEDFFLLAMNYFERAAAMCVRYCEPFFDLQGHTRRGVSTKTVMNGFRRATVEAANRLSVQSKWIMCILRDLSPEFAMSHYLEILPYKDIVVGIGLDSLEAGRPPLLFNDVFNLARKDGFKITCHCDVGEKDSLRNIAQAVDQVGGTGVDRIDHGLHIVDDHALLQKVRSKGIGLTICPWGYLCYSGDAKIFERVLPLYESGVKMAIGSDDPAYMEDVWLNQSLSLLRRKCGLSNADLLKLQRYAVDICWADQEVKNRISVQMDIFERNH